MLTIFRWPKDAVLSFNASWFWCGQGLWTTPVVPDRNRPRLQIIRKATLWQRWLLWLLRPLSFMTLIVVLLTIGMVTAMTIEQTDATAPNPNWTEPIEPPGVVLVTHSSAAALATQVKAAPKDHSTKSTTEPNGTASHPRPETPQASNNQRLALATDTATQAALEQALKVWSQAWQEKNVPVYLAQYADDFVTPKGLSRQAWAQMRTQRIQSKSRISHEMRQVRVSMTGSQAQVSFEQAYADERLQQTDQKTMLWVWREGQWRIARETTS